MKGVAVARAVVLSLARQKGARRATKPGSIGGTVNRLAGKAFVSDKM